MISILFLFSQIEEKIIIKEKYTKPFLETIEEWSNSKAFYISNPHFEPSNAIEVTDTFFIQYFIDAYNSEVGDTIFWDVYFPDFNEQTGEPTGEYKRYARCWYTFVLYDSYYGRGLWAWGGRSDYTSDIDYGTKYFYGSYDKVNDIRGGWGPRPKLSKVNKFVFPGFYPGDWYTELIRKPFNGSEYFLTRGDFQIIDNFTEIDIITPTDGDSVFGEDEIKFKVWENSFGNVEIKIEDMSNGNIIYSNNFKVLKMEEEKEYSFIYDFGFEYGKGYRITAKIQDRFGNEKEDSVKVYVGGGKITITLNPNEIQPYYRDVIPINNSRTEVIVSVKNKRGRAIKDFPIRLFSKRVLGSGGHNHDDNPDAENRPIGMFERTTGITDDNGEFRTNYRASEFGGEDSIYAVMNIENPNDTGKIKLTIRVPNLVLFPDGIYWLKIGGTCEHHGPPTPWDSCDVECQTPDNNHWIDENIEGNLIGVAYDYYTEMDNVRLCINDISLPNGGGFDINGRWNDDLISSLHSSHRLGRNIDISFNVADGNGNVVGVVNRQILKDLVRNYRGNFAIHRGNHYHITF